MNITTTLIIVAIYAVIHIASYIAKESAKRKMNEQAREAARRQQRAAGTPVAVPASTPPASGGTVFGQPGRTVPRRCPRQVRRGLANRWTTWRPAARNNWSSCAIAVKGARLASRRRRGAAVCKWAIRDRELRDQALRGRCCPPNWRRPLRSIFQLQINRDLGRLTANSASGLSPRP